MRPEAFDAISYFSSGFISAMLLAVAVFIPTVLLCYSVGLLCHYSSFWLAMNQSILVFKTTFWTSVVILVFNGIFATDALVGFVIFGGGLVIMATLIYSLYTTPRTVRAYRREQAEWEQRKAQWQQDQHNGLAGY